MIRKPPPFFAGLLLGAALCALAGCSPAATPPLRLPQSEGFINDFAGVIDAEDRARLETLLETVRRETGAQIAVASVKSYAPYASIEDYAEALFNHWGIGRAGEDDGALLLLAMDEREVKIETGYGLEGLLPDSRCGRILDTETLPEFREGRFSRGLLRGAQAVAVAVAAEKGLDIASLDLEPAPLRPEPEAGENGAAAPAAVEDGGFWWLFPLIFLSPFWICLILILRGIVRDEAYRKKNGRYPAKRWYHNSGGRSGGSGGNRSSGGSGFGGGRSGGGGASRRF